MSRHFHLPLLFALTSLAVVACSSDTTNPSSSVNRTTLTPGDTPAPSTSIARKDAALITSTTEEPSAAASKLDDLVQATDTSALDAVADVRTRRLIERATVLLIADCMASKGFDYPVPLDQSQDIPAPSTLLLQSLNLVDASRAAEFGYYQPELAESMAIEEGGEGGPEYMNALYGDLTTEPELIDVVDPLSGQVIGGVEIRRGCVGEADAAVYGGDDNRTRHITLDQVLQQVAIETIQGVKSDPGFRQSVDEWSTCMQEHGYDYGTLDDIAQEKWSDPRPSEHEIAVAMVDVGCKEVVGLQTVFTDTLANIIQPQNEELAPLLNEWRALADNISATALDAIERARTVK